MAYLDNFNPERIDSIPEVRQQLRFLKKAITEEEIGGGGEYPVEVKLPNDLIAGITDFSAEFDKWYNVINDYTVYIRLPEFPTDGKVRSFCVTLVNTGHAESIYFIPASENDFIVEQSDVDYFDGSFHELNFVCVPTTMLTGKQEMTVNIWFVTSTKFNDQPTVPPSRGDDHGH